MSHQEHTPIATHGSALESRYAGENDTLIRMRHSAAHMMAEAVLALFPEAKLGIGPPIEDGFYYDFLLPRTLTPDDLPEIENRKCGRARRRPRRLSARRIAARGGAGSIRGSALQG